MTDISPVSYVDIEAAAARIDGVANVTPIHTSRMLNRLLDATIYFKCENFQRVGAFKFRGAYNALSQLSADQRKRGVLTFSSGNHAQAIALAGSLLDIPTTIVMPNDAPPVKLVATRSYGGNVIQYERSEITREALGQELAAERGLTIVHPYNHPHIVAGQGTAAREFILSLDARNDCDGDGAGDREDRLDVVLTPCGGGGLLSGTAIATKQLCPRARVIGVEPETADDATRSFKTGTLQTVKDPPTIADGTRTPSLGPITFALIRQHVDDMVTVTESAIADATFYLWERLKLFVEPSGALGLAALLSGAIPRDTIRGARIGIILSGGNVDTARIPEYLALRSAP